MVESPAPRQWIWSRREVLLPMAGLLLGLVLLLALALTTTARHFDKLAAEQSAAIAQGALAARQDYLGRVARDHGNSGATYDALHLRLDVDWQDEALQMALAAAHRVDLLCTFDERGRQLIRLSLRAEPAVGRCASAAGLPVLLAAAAARALPRAATPVMGTVRLGHTLAVAAAVAITPGAAQDVT
jgi:sensor domain CHASE-containing protein